MSALQIKKGSSKHSAYNLRPTFSDVQESHTITVLVENEPGVLARVIGLFSGRGYNIESLTVTEVDDDANLSRITIVTDGTTQVLAQIRNLLERLVPVHRVEDLTAVAEGRSMEPPVQRELALVKVVGAGDKRVEALRIADIFKAEVVDTGLGHFVFEIKGRKSQIDRFITLMMPLGLAEICRSGVIAVSRGDQAL